jgi:exodeoxyribonuclease V alpha subunit
MKTADIGIPEKARSAYRYRDHLIRFTVTGYGLPRTSAVEVMLDGEWESGKYGCQLKAEHWEELIPRTKEGVAAYLACGLIKGIGEKTAAEIVERFGINALDVIERQPERLLEVRGISETRLADIKESYAQSRAIRNLMTFLAPFHVTPNTAMRIQEFFGPSAPGIIRERPFELCRVPGFGFVRVDEIARKTGCKPDDPMRIRGALFYLLGESRGGDGHLFLTKEKLCKGALNLLNDKLPQPVVSERAVADELYNIVVNKEMIADGGGIYLPRDFNAEDFTARRVAEILAGYSGGIDVTPVLAGVIKTLGILPSKKQEDAVRMAFQSGLSIITGSPGTGKTTVLKLVIAVFQKLRPKGLILLAAPTGRASRRMAESTGYPVAKTLHSAMGLVTNAENSRANATEPIDADLLIVDEFSMADMWLTSELFSRVKPGTMILLVGDADQLPSVGAGNVFRELITCGLIPVTVLDQIFRQSADSLIAYNAKFINEGKTKLQYGKDFTLIKCDNQQQASLIIQRAYLKEIASSGVEAVQILSPYRSDGDASAEKLNEVIRELVNPAAPETPELRAGGKLFRAGDRVMQTKNKGGVSNGDVGFVKEIRPDGKVVISFTDLKDVEYEPSELGVIELAYAMTVHKAMGSEYDTVILPILTAHSVLLYRNLLYTAITRAKHRVILVGQTAALFMSIHKNRIDKRNTLLGQRITQYYEALAGKSEKSTA